MGKDGFSSVRNKILRKSHAVLRAVPCGALAKYPEIP